MKDKFISKQSNELLTYFNSQNKVCFDYSEAFVALPKSKESAAKVLLSDMTKRGLLMRLKERVYYIIPYEANAASNFFKRVFFSPPFGLLECWQVDS